MSTTTLYPTRTTPARDRTAFLGDWQSVAAGARCRGYTACHRVSAAQRPTYDRLAALCGLHGVAARDQAVAAHRGPVPVAFAVLAKDEWVLWFADANRPWDRSAADMKSGSTEHVLTFSEVRGLVAPPADVAAAPKRTGKAALVSLLTELLAAADGVDADLVARATAALAAA